MNDPLLASTTINRNTSTIVAEAQEQYASLNELHYDLGHLERNVRRQSCG